MLVKYFVLCSLSVCAIQKWKKRVENLLVESYNCGPKPMYLWLVSSRTHTHTHTTNWGGRVGGGGVEQKGKGTDGHGQQCRDCKRQRGTRGLNSNGKNTIKFLNISFKKTNLGGKLLWSFKLYANSQKAFESKIRLRTFVIMNKV